MKQSLKFIMLAMLLTTFARAIANDSTKVETTLGFDVVSRYVWRGQLLGNSPAFQPTMDLTLGGLSIGTWGSYSFSTATFQEVDLYVSYAFNNLTIGVNDYFMPLDTLGSKSDYFNYKNKTTGHTLEPFITWSNIGGSALSSTAAVYVYGYDKDEETGDNYYSTYLELSYGKSLEEFEYSIFCGGTLNEGSYASEAAIINVGASFGKSIQVSDTFSIPVSSALVFNPYAGNVFLVLSFSL